jgi:large subunit ribosomal protein L22
VTGPKLNEGSLVAGERSGTKASAKYIHSSSSKAREVLNIIRGLPVRRADEVLQYTDRSVSVTIRKVLASAVANAQHNDELDPETLFVKACFADEGPTLKRFTPRARGRAGKIFKRTTHITIILGVLEDDRLEVVQAREARRTAAGRRRRTSTATPASSRRARVERSRQRAAALKVGDEGYIAPEDDDTTLDDTAIEAIESEATDTDAIETTATDVEATDTGIAEADEPKDATTTDDDTSEPAVDAAPDAGGEGSASDEPQASRGGNEVDDEGAN